MLHGALEKFGFNEKQQRVYIALAEAGKVTATELSRRTNVPRATLYAILDSLSERGVVSREQTRGSALFVVNNPEAFVRLVEQEKNVLSEKDKAAKDIVDMVAPFLNSAHYSLPKVQVFEGKQNIENMLYDYLPLWRRSYAEVADYTQWGFQDQTFVESYLRWHQHLWNTMSPEEKIRLFSNQADIEKELHHRIKRREVRPLPEGVQFMSSIWIYGDYIIMGMTRNKPHYAVQMKDEVLASNLRTIFQLLWSAKL